MPTGLLSSSLVGKVNGGELLWGTVPCWDSASVVRKCVHGGDEEKRRERVIFVSYSKIKELCARGLMIGLTLRLVFGWIYNYILFASIGSRVNLLFFPLFFSNLEAEHAPPLEKSHQTMTTLLKP